MNRLNTETFGFSQQQHSTRFLYSNNERGIILVGSNGQSFSARPRSTWSQSANLDVIDLTEAEYKDSDQAFERSDEDTRTKQLLDENPKIEPFLQNLDCPVCMESFLSIIKKGNKLMSTICGHVFCQSCLFASIKANRKCPACREVLFLNSNSKQYVHRLYLPISLCKVTTSK